MMVFALLFVGCPLFGIVAYSVWLTRREEATTDKLWALALMLSVYLGCLAATKELLGDFLTYSRYFHEVPRHSGLGPYVASFGKEPLYYGFTYLGYYLTNGSWRLFVIVLTAFNYLLLSYAVIRVGVRLHASLNSVVASLFFMAFFFQEFAAIGNMLRQGLAQSIALVFLVRWHVEGKRPWWMALCALGVHSSCLPVLAVGVLPVLCQKLSWKALVRLVVVTVGLVIAFSRLAGLLSHLPFVGYVFGRAMEGGKLLGADAWQTELGLQPSMLVLMGVLGAMVVFLYRRMEAGGAFVFVNLTLLLLVMMLVCDVLGMYYLQMRYFFYLYAFQNVLLVLFLHEGRLWWSDVRKWLLMGVMMAYFFYELSHGFFSYLPVAEAFVFPLPLYVL